MFEHHHAVAGGKCDGTTRSTLADDAGHHRGPQAKTGANGGGNGLGLATFLGPTAGIGTGGVDKAQHRKAKTAGKIHQPRRLTVALWPGHAEIALDSLFGGAALLGSHHHHRLTTEPGHAADDGVIFGIVAVACQRCEIFKKLLDDGAHTRAFGMPGHLHLFPGTKLFIGGFQLTLDTGLQLADFIGNVDAAVRAHMTELFDLALEGGNWFFKIQKMSHDSLSILVAASSVLRHGPSPMAAV